MRVVRCSPSLAAAPLGVLETAMAIVNGNNCSRVILLLRSRGYANDYPLVGVLPLDNGLSSTLARTENFRCNCCGVLWRIRTGEHTAHCRIPPHTRQHDDGGRRRTSGAAAIKRVRRGSKDPAISIRWQNQIRNLLISHGLGHA